MMNRPHHMLLTPPPPATSSTPLTNALERLVDQVGSVVIGKHGQILDSVACLLAGGHLLIEDVPGVGKTTLAQALAASVGLQFSRVQFTADLTPSDLIGISVYERAREGFVFHQGPVFTQVLLADEINRAGPRTHSALLEAMEERQVSLDGQTHALPAPFFVIATQNPAEQLGTFALPESQLDRFLMCLTLGYPSPSAERALLEGHDRREAVRHLRPVMSAQELLAAQAAVQKVHAAPALLDYLQALIAVTRNGQWFAQGLSPRAALAWLRVARARAFLARRTHVTPEDLQALAVPVLAHRLPPCSGAGRSRVAQVQAMLDAVRLV